MGVEARAAASARIAEVVNAMLAERAVDGIVALYCAKGSEVGTTELDRAVRAAGRRVAYPRVGDGRALTFHTVGRDELAPGRFGLCEPAPQAATVELAEIGAVVVPGLAFDHSGARIGWGRGHYDATLAAMPRAWRVGVAFACQMVDELPNEPHDERMHVIVTEAATYVVGA
ncbi:MAG: 5-formyltetrahydrofolate cyclo-ligase [Deltaproteobacteria bacterium]|nr:5-formyltetrahydrofolate cyclo-ligase [Deltaproteobacteria bacterium]